MANFRWRTASMTNSQVDGPSNLFSEKLIENRNTKWTTNRQETKVIQRPRKPCYRCLVSSQWFSPVVRFPVCANIRCKCSRRNHLVHRNRAERQLCRTEVRMRHVCYQFITLFLDYLVQCSLKGNWQQTIRRRSTQVSRKINYVTHVPVTRVVRCRITRACINYPVLSVSVWIFFFTC